MPDMKKVMIGLECHGNAFCENEKGRLCPYCHSMRCSQTLATDTLVLLKELEAQKQKWLQAIADAQVAVAPTGCESDEGIAKRLGAWDGLQIALDIITGAQKKRR